MNKNILSSKTIWGIIVTLVGVGLSIFQVGDPKLQQSLIAAGLGLAGFGYRSAMTK